MSRFKQQQEQDLSPATRQALAPAQIKGKLPPVYGQMANSEHALLAYWHMESALKRSSLSLRTVEAIKLAVSQHNQCDFCLSNHHVKAGAAGLSEAERLAIRQFQPIGDAQLDAILGAVQYLLTQPGSLPEVQMQALRAQDVSDEMMVDIALALGAITLTNVFNHFNDTDLMLRPAPPLADES